MAQPTIKLNILFGQRLCRYDGEYAPEALLVHDEFGTDENPEYLAENREKLAKTGEFSSLAIITVEVPFGEITRRLSPRSVPIAGTVLPDPAGP